MDALQSIVDRVTAREDDQAPAADAETSLSADDVHDLLANERRRWVLDQLADRPWSIRDLAVALAAYETDQDAREIDSQERKRAYVGLYQTHLPELDGLGVVEWNHNADRIYQGPEFDGVRAIQLDARARLTTGGDD